MRIAAVGDLHFGEEGHGASRQDVARIVAEAQDVADVLVLCGDLTTHGRPAEAHALIEALDGLDLPTLTVLGNHEFEAGAVDEVIDVLRERGIHVLDGDTFEVDGVGFAGVKGFAGGFGRGSLGAFGEPLMKAFVQEAVDEALKLENALRKLGTPVRAAVLHYAPIQETIEGEPPEIQAFLGSTRLLPPLDSFQVDVVFHGHAHSGRIDGHTPGGVPVFNVSLPLLQREGRLLHLWDVPERELARR